MGEDSSKTTCHTEKTGSNTDGAGRASTPSLQLSDAPPKHAHRLTVQADVHREPMPPHSDRGQEMANTPSI
ncbi:Hypp3744 [Branchiostoma lanceolatum]|uniref:Hypp3744 protein n=1 Tax=Branchiostoma lanceolatum TaxID=7740 RepID=A0A8K0A1B4_BRALA|nr:Hypp3744 [Branchiostoma lanceolatum]